MNYSRLQRYLSSLLIFSILFLQTVEIPLLDSTSASAQMNADLISFIVDTDIYSGTVKSKINRYAEDIQAYLPHSRVVIFPVSKVSNPFNIASINEKLYYEGDGEGLSRLVGTILIGEVPVPVVHRDNTSFLSVYPYVDFDNKSFIYDQMKKSYEYTTRVTTEEKPEAWHSVIRPNTGTADGDESKLIAFLDKTHDFYLSQGVFSAENTRSEPRVLYFDALHDQLASSAENLQSYELFLANIEDIAYNRFNKYLARALSDATAGIMNISPGSISDPDIRAILEEYSGSVMDISNAPDITTKDIIEKAAKQFFEVFNAKYMGDILRFVHNAGRYGDANNVRVDSIPTVIAKKDILMRQTLKDTNTVIESAIDQAVRNSMSNPIKVFTSYEYTTKSRNALLSSTSLYKNYFFGQKAEDITKTEQCTIVRGWSGTGAIVAEANRGYDITQTEPDLNLLLADLPRPQCLPGGHAATQSFWWGNSPLNLDTRSMSSGVMALWSHTYTGFVKPIFDIAGFRELEADSPLHQSTPLDCYTKDFLLQPHTERDSDGDIIYWPGEKGSALDFSCLTTHRRPTEMLQDYKTYLTDLPPERCTVKKLELDGVITKQVRGECVVDGPSSTEDDTTDPDICDEPTARICSRGTYHKTYRFKTISSVMTHKSPTDEEYGKELTSLTTPSLPSDRDRYVDFLDKHDQYAKIIYPNFFRISLAREELNSTWALAKIRQLLDAKTAEIRSLGGDINLYDIVASDSKALNALVESVIFHNMDNATLKYASLLEQSLDIDGVSKTSLDNRKNDYEIAYLGAPGDAKWMYVKVDPAEKWPLDARLTDISDRVSTYHGLIDGTNVVKTDDTPEFKCGPPEGVPIYEWMPAIFCWLGDMLPPTIGAGSCTDTTIGENGGDMPSEDHFSELDSNRNNIPDINEDANKNGIVDGNEIIATGQLVLNDPEDHIYGYNENILLEARLMKDGRVITVDNFNKVSFGIKKIIAYSGGTAPRNGRIVYESGATQSLSDIDNIAQYVNFTPMTVRADKWVAQYRFTAKNSDVDVVLDAHILTRDQKGNIVVDKTATPITLSIRSDRIAVQSSVRTTGTLFENGTVIDAGNPHGIRFKLQRVSHNEIVPGGNLPYTLRVYDDIDNTLLLDPINVSRSEYLFQNPLLEKSWVYRMEFTDRRGIRGYTTITILPALPSRIEMTPASNIFVKDAKTTVLVKVLDRFGNYANTEVLSIGASVFGGGVLLDADGREVGDTLTKNIIEGYTSFDLTSHGVHDTIQFKIRIPWQNLESSLLTLRSIEGAKIAVEIEDKDNIVVGKEKHRLKIRVKDNNGNILSWTDGVGGFNGIVSLDFPKLSGTVEPAFARVVDGVSVEDIFFVPKYAAGKNLALDVQIPGVQAVEGNTVTVLPDTPMSFEFSGGGGKTEAKEGNSVSMRASLSDRYGNIADNTTGYRLTLDVPEKYRKYATFRSGTWGYMKTVTFSWGVADFSIMTTSLPGKAYIVGRVSPGLDSHSFTITDKSGQSVTVNGISENITTLSSYYIFNKEKLDRIRYDALYSVLLGGNYGDITEQEYLGGEILFNPDSKSLAVTTLLNNPWREKGLFGFTPAGKYTLVAGNDETEGLQTEISSNTDQSFIAFYDSFHKEYIARSWLNIDPESTAYMPCQSTGSTINDCLLSTDKTTVFMKGFDGATATLADNELILSTPSGTRLVHMNRDGKIEKYPGVELELDVTNTANLLGIRILSNRVPIGYVGIKFSSSAIQVVPSSNLASTLTDYRNSLVIETLSARYNHQKTYLGISSRGSQGVMFGLRDTASTDELDEPDDAYSGRQWVTGFEQYPKKTGIGWEEDNRTLLDLAGGGTIGEATKWYQTFSTITLGDPVAHLPRASQDQHFDHTIGKEISIGAGEQIESYKKIDFNGDTIPDIVVFYESGKIQLLANYKGSFKDMGYLAYVSDAGKERKGTGDFFNDNFEDIVLIDKEDRLVLVDNVAGKFTRKEPIILDASGSVTALAGHIQQLEVFDMDHDEYSDIVTVDDAGELNILYGGVQSNSNGTQDHIFTKKLIDDGLGLKLSTGTRNDDGAFHYAWLTYPDQIDPTDLSGAVNQWVVDNLVYYRFGYSESLTGTFDPTSIDTDRYPTASWAEQKVFIRSQFAEWKGLKVEKKYTLLKDANLNRIESNNRVEVELKLTNTSGHSFADGIYLDSNDAKLFRPNEGTTYTLTRSGTGGALPIKSLVEGEYDYAFDLGSILAWEVVTITYKINIVPFSYGKIQVGLLEKWETGDDIYGDISLSPNNMCGGDLILWRSTAVRSYQKGTKTFSDRSELPEELQKNTIDADGNDIPDYIDELIKSGKGDTTLLQNYNKTQLEAYNEDTNNNRIPDRVDKKGDPLLSYDPSNKTVSIAGLSSANIDAIDSQVDDIIKGLGCGFGWGSCLSMPLNWAPLAPGTAPSALGYPLGSLNPGTGLPAFSALTGIPLYGSWGCIRIPSVWPISPIGFENTCWSNLPNAGWYLGTTSPFNFFRLYVTPTITGAIGVAACFGGNSGVSGRVPPQGVSPIVPGGNCIVAAKPFFGCKDDGSDGDLGSWGLGSDSDNSYINANSCRAGSSNSILSSGDRSNLLRYVGGDRSVLPEINASMAAGNIPTNLSAGPLIGIGQGSGEGSNFETSIDVTALKNFDFGNIVKIKNDRVSAFPDFLMDWANRQLEEVVNKLTSLPTLYVIFPDFAELDISGYKDFPEKLGEAFKSARDWDKKNYSADTQSNSRLSNSTLQWFQGQYNSAVSSNGGTINSLGQNVSGVKAAYEFISHLPLVKLENQTVDISVPWMSFEESDKWLVDAELTLKKYKKEKDDKVQKWTKAGTPAGVDSLAIVQSDTLINSLEENIRIIKEYRKFPEKLQKYLTWKERYATQILCNIEAIEMMMGGWISENGQRFRTWVELYMLIKSILKSWQLIVDLFYDYEAECAVCRNERYDLKQFIFKIVSAIIPKIPIVQFPKWPDVWLDLHNIRAGLPILMPEFHFNFVPIVLPQLPNFFLPDVPTASLDIPNLPLLPRLPELPELPDMPSLPLITLPDLPPPPTIPRLLGSIAAVLDIFKLVAKAKCIMNINPFVPEWRAGDQIAQITERQGKSPIDFIDLEYPNFPMSFTDAIKVKTYVNLEFETEFILEMARATLGPLNTFTNNVSNLTGSQPTIPNADLRNTVPDNIDVNTEIQGYVPKEHPLNSLVRRLSFDLLGNFITLNTYMHKHVGEEATVAVFKDILQGNITTIQSQHDPRTLAITDTLQKAVDYRGDKEDALVKDLTAQNTEKFRVLKEYIRGEKTETTRLKTEINAMLRSGKISESIPSLSGKWSPNIKIAALNNSLSANTRDVQKQIRTNNEKIIPSIKAIASGWEDSERKEIVETGKKLLAGVKTGLDSFARDMTWNASLHADEYKQSSQKLLALETSAISLSAPTSSTDSSSYSYEYNGIYILDKNGKQTRLFDYTDGVDGTEELLYMDCDGDGDDDIVYRMGNSLYLKENAKSHPEGEHDTSSPERFSWLDFLGIDNETLTLAPAPNYFEENFTSSNEINFWFTPAGGTKDNLFRLEYYDYIDRFDRINGGEQSSSIHPKTGIHKVDLIPSLLSETVIDTTISGFVGRKNIATFGRWTGGGMATMRKYQKLSSASAPIIIAANRTIYTDAGGATIEYLREWENANKTLFLDDNTNYEFLASAKIWVKTGNIYLFNESTEEKLVNLGDLRGIPVLPDTKIEIDSDSAFISFDYYDESTMRLDGPGAYEYYSLWEKSLNYSVSLSATNDWYYARLYSFSHDKTSTIVNLTLLSPQRQADKEWPLITYGDTIRVPVYQRQTVSLAQYISDISGVKRVSIDTDLTKDTDGDGNVTNDADSLDPHNTSLIKQGRTIFDLELGAFDSLFIKKVRLTAEDENGNKTSKDLNIVVYAPIPQIQSISGSVVSGIINESLVWEPIDIFRFRNGKMIRIESENPSSTFTAESGLFAIPMNHTPNLTLKRSGSGIANISETTGKIDLQNPLYSISVLGATNAHPLKIQIKDATGQEIFSQRFSLPSSARLEEVTSLDGINKTGLYVLPGNLNISFVKNISFAPTLPNWGYITDGNKRAIAGISAQGDIYILDDTHHLTYDTSGSFIVLRLRDQSEQVVASILYRVNGEYVVR